ncbi:MAG: secretin N-terminal domain-containing protein [Phycisphaerales bacterium]
MGQSPQPVTALTEQIELTRLLDLCADRLKLNIEYDPGMLRGAEATLRMGEALSDQQLWSLVNQLLAARGLTTVRAAGASALSVVKVSEAASVAGVVERQSLRDVDQAPRPGFQSVLVRPAHRSARELAEAIKPFLSKQGSSTVGSAVVIEAAGASPIATSTASGLSAVLPAAICGQGGLLIVSDFTARLEQTLRLLDLVDSPAEATLVEEVALQHLGGVQMAALATQVATRQGAIAGRKLAGEVLPSPNGGAVLLLAPASQAQLWRELIAQLDRREPVEVVNYAPRSFGIKDVAKLIEQTVRDTPPAPESGKAATTGTGAEERLRVVLDELTGTLIVTATPTQHQRIASLIARLDSVSPAARRPVRTFVLRNRPVAEVMSVIQNLVQAGALEGDVESAPAGEPGTPSSGVPDRPATRDQPILAGGSAASMPPPTPPDSARPRRGGADAAVNASSAGSPHTGGAALSLTADEQTNTLIAVAEPRVLGQIESLLATIDVRQPQVMLEVLLLSLTDTQTLALGIELERLTKAGDAQFRLSSLFGLSMVNAGTPTAPPGGTGGTVTVLSPAEFSILIRALETLNEGRSLSIPRLLVGNNQVGDFLSVLQQPVTTTVTPSSQVTTTTFGGYEQAGTTVSVQPRIAEGDHLGLKYSVTLSAFTGTSSMGLPPPKQENTIKSDVLIPDAYTVALGGIELTTTGEGTTQVPFLGDLPIIGEVFKSRSNNSSRTRFYVFIRAEVMRQTTFEDLKYASDRATSNAGVDDGFPDLEPLLMR